MVQVRLDEEAQATVDRIIITVGDQLGDIYREMGPMYVGGVLIDITTHDGGKVVELTFQHQ